MNEQQRRVNRSAGSTATSTVGIYFADRAITEIFAALLQSEGLVPEIIGSSEELCARDRVITEPQYYPLLRKDQIHRSLIVGNKDALLGVDAPILSRPLTEEKVERALHDFLQA